VGWLRIFRIGKAVVQILDREGVKVKGKKVGDIVEIVEKVATTAKRVQDLRDAKK
jgi:hypothetical protein